MRITPASASRFKTGIRLASFYISSNSSGSIPACLSLELREPSVPASQVRPEVGLRAGGVGAFVAREEGAAVEDVALQPDLRREARPDRERVAAQRPAVDEHFEPEPPEVEVDPVELAPRERVAERLEGDDPPGQAPVVLVRGARGRGLLERLPADALAARARDARAVGEPAQPDVQLRRAEAFGADLGQVLQLEEHLGLRPVAVAVDDGLAVLVVLGQRPRADALRVAGAEAGAAVGVENLARPRLVEHRPHFEPLAQLPAAAVEDGPAPEELRRLALIAGPLGEMVEILLARHFRPDGLERLVHRNSC